MELQEVLPPAWWRSAHCSIMVELNAQLCSSPSTSIGELAGSILARPRHHPGSRSLRRRGTSNQARFELLFDCRSASIYPRLPGLALELCQHRRPSNVDTMPFATLASQTAEAGVGKTSSFRALYSLLLQTRGRIAMTSTCISIPSRGRGRELHSSRRWLDARVLGKTPIVKANTTACVW